MCTIAGEVVGWMIKHPCGSVMNPHTRFPHFVDTTWPIELKVTAALHNEACLWVWFRVEQGRDPWVLAVAHTTGIVGHHTNACGSYDGEI